MKRTKSTKQESVAAKGLDWNNLTDEQFENLYGYPRNPPAPKPFASWIQPFNSRGLALYAQARELAAAINARKFIFPSGGERPMGGGVIPGDDEKGWTGAAVGIFVERWFGQESHSFTDPQTGLVYRTLLLRFVNGSTQNAGMILDKLSRFPLAQDYAVGQIAIYVEGSPTTG